MAKRKRKKKKPVKLYCQHCGKLSEFVTGEAIYPHRPDLFHLHFYLCRPCWAYVGVHIGTKKPKGTLANDVERMARKRAHSAFDPLWKSGRMRRGQAYAWLARTLELPEIHIGESDVERCVQIAHLSRAKWNELNEERKAATNA